MPKERLLDMSTPAQPAATPRGRPAILPMLLIVLLAIVVIGTGVGYVATSTGPTTYSCISLSHQGSSVVVKTTGLVHYLKSQYYITCTEGSPLPTSPLTYSCLTVTPQSLLAPIGVGATTYYYYLSAPGHTTTLQGAPAPTNGTEIITPWAISLLVNC
jgi:hypothetical protein